MPRLSKFQSSHTHQVYILIEELFSQRQFWGIAHKKMCMFPIKCLFNIFEILCSSAKVHTSTTITRHWFVWEHKRDFNTRKKKIQIVFSYTPVKGLLFSHNVKLLNSWYKKAPWKKDESKAPSSSPRLFNVKQQPHNDGSKCELFS